MLSESILVINTGSSSMKAALFAADTQTALLKAEASGLEDSSAASLVIDYQDSIESIVLSSADHASALTALIENLRQKALDATIKVIGHRIVHGGEYFNQAQCIDSNVKEKIEACIELAPLHNPANLAGIEVVEALLPGLPQVAVFDTAFHQSLPPHSFYYAIPVKWTRQHKVRRFGFHGINHQYIAQTSAVLLQKLQRPHQLVSAHLGNGCSICAIKDGKSIDTSMGFTPLEGLVMGTRSGDIDAGLLEYICEKENMSVQAAIHILNKESGLKGVSELSHDMRQLLQAADSGHQGAQLAIDLFCYRLAKAIASYLVPLGNIEAVVFTGGIGEHAAPIRLRVIGYLEALDFQLNETLNSHPDIRIRNIASEAHKPVFVIPANEEWMIAQQSWKVIQEQGVIH